MMAREKGKEEEKAFFLSLALFSSSVSNSGPNLILNHVMDVKTISDTSTYVYMKLGFFAIPIIKHAYQASIELV